MVLRFLFAVLMLAGLAACQSPTPVTSVKLVPGTTRVAVFPAHVEIHSRGIGGREKRDDWAADAARNIGWIVEEIGGERGLKVVRVDPLALNAEERDETALLTSRHASHVRLLGNPDEYLAGGRGKDRPLASLGEDVRLLAEKTGAQIGLFVMANDTYPSGGHHLGSFLIGGVAGMSANYGGSQEGYASLVDLRTGEILWFSRLERIHGNLKDMEAARQAVEDLLRDLPGAPGEALRAAPECKFGEIQECGNRAEATWSRPKY